MGSVRLPSSHTDVPDVIQEIADYAQAVMGHVSGTITFDTYGSGVPVETIALLLKELFTVGFKSDK